jgi:hypothetical protein
VTDVCDAQPAGVFPDIDPEGSDWHYVDFTQARWLERGEEVTAAVRYRVKSAPGYEFECTNAGQTAAREPIFPKVIASTVQDGSAVFTCRALSTASLLRALSGTPVWSGGAVTVFSGQTATGQLAKAFITMTNAVDGTDYEVLVKATFDDGAVIPKRCILPARKAVRVCCA